MNDSSVCPDAQVLEQFLQGGAPADEARRVNKHLQRCVDCRRALDALRGAEATNGEGRPHASEQATLPPSAAGPPVAPADAGRESFPFLAPPQADDEMGRLGPYRVLRVLGAGGMGVVFEAEDPKLQRRVALKVMRPAGARQGVFRERFLREARAAARLEHDHVVPVYQVDEDRGVLFLAMPLLRGETLEDRLQREPKPPLADVLRIGREMAEGLDAAHSHGLIHRDVKPSNVWLETGRGRVKVLDFGLARVADDVDERLTQEGLVMGTPAFMAPEQAKGLPVDPRCDLFSLGCILYRMTTGRNAFQGANPFSLMVAVATEDPPTPTALEPEVPPALAELIMKLLAKEPARRPASAREVVDQLAAVKQADQATQAVAAVPSTPVRRRRPFAVLLVLFVLVGVLAAVAWRFGPQIAGLFAGASGPDKGPSPGNESLGTLVIESEDPQLKVIVLRDGAVAVPATTRRQLELKPGGYDVELAPGGQGAQLEPTHFEIKEGDFITVQVKPAAAAEKPGDALTGLALAGRPAPIAGVRSWTVETRGHRGPVHDAACSPTDHMLATAGADGSVRLWDLESGKLLRILLAHEHAVRAVAWSPDGKTLAALGAAGIADLWDPESGKLLLTIHTGPSRALAWSKDGGRLATGGDKKISLWEALTGKPLPPLEGQAGETRALAWSPDGKITAGVADRVVRLWEPDKSKDPRTLAADPATEPIALAWSPDGKLLAVGRTNLSVQIWEIGAPDKILQTLPPFGAIDKDRPAAVGLAWAPKGRKLAVIGPGGVQLWVAAFDKPTRPLDAPGAAVSWSADGKRLVTSDEATGVRVWDASAPGRPSLLVALPVYRLERVAAEHWAPDGKQVALQGEQTVRLFSATGRLAQTLRGPTHDVTALAWSPDGKRIAAAGGWDRQVYVWDAASGKLVRTYTAPHPDCEITALAWSPDDRTLAIGVDRPVETPLWDVDGGKPAIVLKGEHTAAINALLWLDAKTLVTGSADDNGVFWSAETGKVLRTIHPGKPGPARPVTALVLAPDGKSFAAGLGDSLDHAARLFDVASERPIQNLRGPGVAEGQLAWLPDGKTMVGRSNKDGVLRFWDAETGLVTRTMPPRPGLAYLLPERGIGACTSSAFSVRFWGLDDFRPETTVVLMQRDGLTQWLSVTGDGHYAAAKELEPDVVYVVRTDAGMQTLSAKEFAATYFWKNEADRVGLPAGK